MDIEVTRGEGIPVPERKVEIVERKGKGHPDTLCDKAAEELSIKLSEYYMEEFGGIQHHNVDKVLLVGGQSVTPFGGGDVIEPIYILLSGRAVSEVVRNGDKSIVPVGKFAVEHTKQWLQGDLPHLDVSSDVIVDYKIRAGSTDLVGNFEVGVEVPRANDTSFGVAYGPMSDTEILVLKAEELLNTPKIKKDWPQIGEDIKVMGTRVGDSIHIQVAAAIISTETRDADEYAGVMQGINDVVCDMAAKITDLDVEVSVNTADEPDEGLFYLTVTGTSAEHGDDGQVGRGNRANGLITPYRPMTLEAAAGKNPISHVGKTYNVAAREIVNKVILEHPDLTQVYCYVVSQIGAPITEPKAVNVELYGECDVDKVRGSVQSIIEEECAKLPEVWRGFVTRKYQLW
ncbi:MAG: methionine adenosyltransferase [Candidatus Thorarchaeota archaeon]|nr:MAG: methionine adenosyltransferase [Candidatus Thorarchaeota archaeon]